MMRKSVIFALLTLISNSAIPVTDAELQPLLREPFVKASFIKARQLKVLSRPFVTSGVLLFAPGKGVVWHTTRPVEDIVLINEAGIRNVGERQDVLAKSMSQNPVMKSVARLFIALFSLDLDRIRQEFEIVSARHDASGMRYRLRTKDATLSSIIEEITLRGQNRVNEIVISEKSGDSTTINISDELFDVRELTDRDRELLGQL